ncbi:MAG: 3-isopropylmalate dehydratase small subunit [Candidatus Bathyarchaeota archaeon]|nr:MAG: 3-isopropylmalate dehydratase small subunit [Candidatus Bathyarchaeota archaeon]
MIKGRAVMFGDNVNTDVILPGEYLTLTDPGELAKHVMEGLDPTFSGRVESGVIMVAGRNFGCGSSREHAPLALKHAGVRCILADSFARIFYRNSINIGLPVFECRGILGEVEEGDELEVDLETGSVKNLSKNSVFYAFRLPKFILEILSDGGLIKHLRRRLKRTATR